jgi:hypothetical protein
VRRVGRKLVANRRELIEHFSKVDTKPASPAKLRVAR